MPTDAIAWRAPRMVRPGSPRAVAAVRAKIAQVRGRKSRLEVFITEPVLRGLGWPLGGSVEAHFAASNPPLCRLRPAHKGLTLSAATRRTRTARVTIGGHPFSAASAKVRCLPYSIEDGALYVTIPSEWRAEAGSAEPIQQPAGA